MRNQACILAGALCCLPALFPVGAAEVGAPIEVAPKAGGTRSQTFARVAWAAESRTWLVVWREGYMNEPETGTEIWGARVSAEGKALDPAGICIAKGKGLKDSPRVASDGKSWLVVWEDLRNGKAPSTASTSPSATSPSADSGPSGSGQAGSGQGWDVYGARVSGEGKVLDENGFLIAGGENNQARPDVAFAKGGYTVVWMRFANGGYGVFSTLVSTDGKVAEPAGADVASFPAAERKRQQILFPSLASNGSDVLAVFRSRQGGYGPPGNRLGRRVLDGATGKQSGPLALDARFFPKPEDSTYYDGATRPEVAMGKTETFMGWFFKPNAAISLVRLSNSGELGSGPNDYQEVGTAWGWGVAGGGLLPRTALAYCGTGYLAVSDAKVAVAGTRAGEDKYYAKICGWRVAPDGKLLDDPKAGFDIAGTPDKDCILPAAAGGPEGVALVAYSELRGADDIKVLARVVK